MADANSGDGDCSAASLAALIASSNTPPDWLMAGITKATAGLERAIVDEEQHPSRDKLLLRIKVARDAARFLVAVQEDKSLMRVVREAAGDDPEADIQLYRGLAAFIRRLELALPKVPSGRGSHKFDPGTNSPVEICALSVAFAWRKTRGTLPPHTSRVAHEACRLFWKLGGGAPTGYGGNHSLRGWQMPLQQAKAALAKGDRPEISRLFDVPARQRPPKG